MVYLRVRRYTIYGSGDYSVLVIDGRRRETFCAEARDFQTFVCVGLSASRDLIMTNKSHNHLIGVGLYIYILYDGAN